MINGCNNRPRPVAGAPVDVQDGYRDIMDGMGNLVTVASYVQAPFRMSTDCQYDASARDQGCAGCQHAPHLRGAAA
jgi:hypothetical protein